MEVADVIGAPFEQRNRYRRIERFAYRRDIAQKELVLQILGAGRYDHLATPQQGGHQIGKGLAGTVPASAISVVWPAMASAMALAIWVWAWRGR